MDHSGGMAEPEPGSGGRGVLVPNSKRKPDARSELAPYLPAAEGRAAREPWRGKGRFFSRALWGILAAGFLGLASMAGAALLSGKARIETVSAPAAAARGSMDEKLLPSEILRQAVEALDRLKAEFETLRASMPQTGHDQTGMDPSRLVQRLDELSARLDGVKTETRGSIAELAGKIEPVRQEAANKWQQVIERLDRIERQTGTGAPPSSPAPGRHSENVTAKAPQPAGAAEDPKRPALITNWIVRDVYDGLALVEGAAGAIEVAPGEVLPGAGRVKSIERRGMGWIVITSRGVIDQARGPFHRRSEPF